MIKKVLVFTLVAGGGHISAAKSVSEKLKQQNPDIEIEVVDCMKEYGSKFSAWSLQKGYAISIGKTPLFYHVGYWLCNHGLFKNFYASIPLNTARKMTPKLFKKINEYKPDVIYCTHFYPALAISLLRQKYNVPCCVIESSLDYAVEPFFDKTRKVDYITIANEDFIEGRLHSGFKEEQIAVTGIPTQERFFREPNKSVARKKLNLDPKMFTVLVMFGGGEWSGAHKIFRKLIKDYHKEIQVIVINGNNKKSFRKIAKYKVPDNIKVMNVGFTTEVELYMAASDIALTKAGGLSTTEMVNSELPMLISTHVYGQERRNMEFLMKKGVALSFKDSHDLHKQLMIASNMIDGFKPNFKKIKKNGVANIANLILSQEEAKYDDEYIATIDYKKVDHHMKILQDELIHKTTKKIHSDDKYQ